MPAIDPNDRWMAVGRSEDLDAYRAGSEAVVAALAGGSDARLLIVFAADRYEPAALLAGIRASSGATPLIGCSTAGEIASSGPGDAGVVVTALGGAGFRRRLPPSRSRHRRIKPVP